jgi:uncharacterized protein (DUF362 family)
LSERANGERPATDTPETAARTANEPRVYTRREVISKATQASVATAVTMGAASWLYSRFAPKSARPVPMGDHRVTRPAGTVEMAIARGPSSAENLRQALKAMGGIEAFVEKGDKVVIKPNVAWNRLPEQAANTNPELVAEMVLEVVAAGASEVWVTDVPVNRAEATFARSGIGAAAREAGGFVVLPDDNGFSWVEVNGGFLDAVEVWWPFVEADKIINMPIAKDHRRSGASMCLKSWFGVAGGQRMRLHDQLDQSIVDLATMIKPTLTVLDATRVLMANGPQGGNLDDVKRFDTVAVGIDEVALDAYGAILLGRNPNELGFLVKAAAAGLGRLDYKSLKIEELGG